MKNWQEAHSQTARNRLWEQYLGTLRHRLDDEHAPIIVCHARWHQDDISGRLIEQTENDTGEQFEVIELAAIAEEDRADPLGRQPGEVLEPERFSLAAVQARHKAMGSYLAAGLEQQRPASPVGSIIRRDWWQYYTVLPAQTQDWLISVDTSFKDTSTADFCVLQVWARAGADFYLVDQTRDRMSYVAAKRAIQNLHQKYPQAARILIEDTANGPAIMNDLKRDVPGLVARPAKSSKEARLHSISGYIEAGNVHLPEKARWLADYVDELTEFPGVTNDDQVDATTQALIEFTQRTHQPIRTSTAAGRTSTTPGPGYRGPRRRARGRSRIPPQRDVIFGNRLHN
jgi:predicted phage terminase large subunit-like protein